MVEPIEDVFNELKKNRSEKNFFSQKALRPMNFNKKTVQLNLNINDTLTTRSSNDNIERKKIRVKSSNLNYLLNKIKAPRVIDFFSLEK